MLMVPISLLSGDVIELVGSSDSGLLEGVLRGATGLFSRDVVQVSYPPPPLLLKPLSKKVT
jgi:hypothetical protein